jgi:7-cyano-7-deazaguanine synthase
MDRPSFPPSALPGVAGRTVVLLLSGGLDSATCLALATTGGARVLALTIDYNQRHRIELEAAAHLARHYAVERHIVLPLDLRQFGGSALTADIAVPRAGLGPGIPVTYVPARNSIFLSVALGWAEAAGARDLVIGVNALDYSGYPDCRPDFLGAFEALANVATRAGVEGAHHRVHAPLIAMSKADIARTAVALGVPVEQTWSCYDPGPDGRPCGLCDSCRLRARGFAEAALVDRALAR